MASGYKALGREPVKLRYLLDTNVLSELINDADGEVAQKIRTHEKRGVATSLIVAGELRYGVAKKQSRQLTQKVERLLSRLTVLPLESGVDFYYAKIRVELERQGLPIGHNDLLIAAHALALNLIVVTANVREFERVPGLAVENWGKG